MNYFVDIQHVCKSPLPISNEILEGWVTLTLKNFRERAELTLRFVDADEMTTLNHTYRQQNKVTNVLAFPASYPSEIQLDYPMIGDVVICPEVLLEESKKLNTPLEAHWAHIIIHGVLHLLGYDHIEESDAEIMRPIETKILHELGFDNPYLNDDITEDNSLE